MIVFSIFVVAAFVMVAAIVVAFVIIVCVFFSCIVFAVDIYVCVIATVDFIETGRAVFVVVAVFIAFHINAGVIVCHCDIQGCKLVIGTLATLQSGKLIVEFMKLSVKVRKLVAEIRKLGVRLRLFVVGIVSRDNRLAAFWEGHRLGANGFLGCACHQGQCSHV